MAGGFLASASMQQSQGRPPNLSCQGDATSNWLCTSLGRDNAAGLMLARGTTPGASKLAQSKLPSLVRSTAGRTDGPCGSCSQFAFRSSQQATRPHFDTGFCLLFRDFYLGWLPTSTALAIYCIDAVQVRERTSGDTSLAWECMQGNCLRQHGLPQPRFGDYGVCM